MLQLQLVMIEGKKGPEPDESKKFNLLHEVIEKKKKIVDFWPS